MKLDKKFIVQNLRDLFIVTAIGILFSILFKPHASWQYVYTWSIYSLLIGFTLWKGNEFGGYLVEKKYPWKNNPKRTFRILLISGMTFSTLNILLVNFCWFTFVLNLKFFHFVLNQGGFWILIIQILITLIISFILYTKSFFSFWTKALVNEEKLKRESLALQYEALKNQVNPHFLFNSLNVLTTLVHKDQNLAEKFINQLSKVYRYVLEQKDKEVVDVSTEVKFVESYIYLQKIRYNESLHVDIDLDSNKDEMVLPLSVQILVENAIKHNIVSEDEPLKIGIYTDKKEYLVVENNLQKRQVVQGSGNLGLSNIRLRYEHLTEKSVIISESDEKFIVKIPLIKMTKQ